VFAGDFEEFIICQIDAARRSPTNSFLFRKRLKTEGGLCWKGRLCCRALFWPAEEAPRDGGGVDLERGAPLSCLAVRRGEVPAVPEAEERVEDEVGLWAELGLLRDLEGLDAE